MQCGIFDGLKSFCEFEARISALATKQERGDVFEVFVEAYLATLAVEKAKQVWPGARVPSSLRKRLALPSADKGVDGVFETQLGKYHAYQAKFRTGRPSLTWDELSTFIGLADRVDQRLLITNSDRFSNVLAARRGFYAITGNDFDKLEAQDFAVIRAWLEGAKIERHQKTPLPHQAEALANILPALRDHDRATALMACGTGKTLVALWVAERMGAQNILVLVPSLALLRQTLHEWARETSLEGFAHLCVCSDPTVTKPDSDELVVLPTDLDFPVTTDSTQVRAFLAAKFDGVKLVFSTYQSAHVVAAGMKKGDAFDLAIFDEAHKTAGRDGVHFGFALNDKNLAIKKRLFLTATPRHYDVRQRDKEGDARLVYSMDVPEVYGPVAHKLTFAEAARRGVICDYKVIISVVTSAMVNDHLLRHGEVMVKGDAVKARHVANQLALQAAVEKHGVGKIFTFHRSVAGAAAFTSEGSEGIGNHLSGFDAFHVNGSMPTSERENIMTEFRASPRAVISNAKCLTEGVDVPAVDMVAFLTPKRSRVDIVQATGRAMRKASGKTTGYVLVPLFVEQAAGETIEAALARTGFDEVWAVLQAMQEQDEVLDDLVHQMQAARRLPEGFDDARFRERVEVLGPTVTLDNLRRAITTFCLDRLAHPWDEMVQLLLAFRKQHRHLRVPKEAPAPWAELGLWVDHVRALKRNGHLSSERQAQLGRIGFCWRVAGETLDDTVGLLNENQFEKASRLSNITRYRKKGLIKPVGFAMAGPGISPYYHPRQIPELKKALGITLGDTRGLLNEKQFEKECRLRNVARHRKERRITPVGYALNKAGVGPYYHPRQIAELKKALGITLKNTKGLLSHGEFKAALGLTSITDYRKRDLIKPVGFAMNGPEIGAFYHPRQMVTLKRKMGVTLETTKGLLNENQFRAVSGLSNITKYREKSLIKPIGYGLTNSGVRAFYHPRQIAELKKTLGITLANTQDLLNETEFMRAAGLFMIAQHCKRGLIKPVGQAMSASKLSRYYHPRQIAELKKKLGITLKSTKGLLNEWEFENASRLRKISDYRKRGLIKPVGFGITSAGISAFYRPSQINKLRARLASLKKVKVAKANQ